MSEIHNLMFEHFYSITKKQVNNSTNEIHSLYQILLYQPVRLGVVGGSRHVHDVEDRAEGSPERRGKLRAAVARDGRWDAETLNPAMQKRVRAGGRGRGRQRNGFRPSRRAIHNSKKIIKTRRHRQRAYDVDVHVREPPGRNWNVLRAQVDVAVHLTFLAIKARAAYFLIYLF